MRSHLNRQELLCLCPCLVSLRVYQRIRNPSLHFIRCKIVLFVFGVFKAPAKQLQHVNATYHNIVGRNMLRSFGHRVYSRPQSPRSFWPVAGIESSGRTRFSEYAQSIRLVISTNQIWWEVRESRTSGVRPSQSSRSLPQARRIVGSGDENGSVDTTKGTLAFVTMSHKL